MSDKIRRVDYYPDEMIAGVAGRLSPADFGVYWMVCTLIASRGGEVDDDAEWMARVFAPGTRPKDVRATIDRLVAAGKLTRDGGCLTQTRNDGLHLDLRLPFSEWRVVRERIFERDDYTCQYCGNRGGSLECDHVVPVSRGGNNSDGNLVTACKLCNREKGARLVSEWLQ